MWSGLPGCEKGWFSSGSSRQRWWCALASARNAGAPPANSNMDGRDTTSATAFLAEAEQVAGGIAERAVANAVRLVDRLLHDVGAGRGRSEERRVGKECR